MDVIVIRHGIALDATTAHGMGLSDAERPLTAAGERATRAAAIGLRQLLSDMPVDDILTSPLLRARQTAAIIAPYLDDAPIDQADVLAPPVDVSALDDWLHTHFGERRVVLVGHEPDLAAWTSWSLTRKRDRLLSFSRAGAALLEFPGAPEGGTGSLRWLLTGTQLQQLA
ncbi:histidine phosphatase family protein [Salinisphaera sp. Q1T1-3]|uniref:SixA phosphatase family protein n=1 Tax=Salinisphaera sp. Q1T1-3 TaxID=2321229 RepID=UPI001314DF3A|nr:histidine phosphatase family protein [Salinisphaera sp. Q1T1-3]